MSKNPTPYEITPPPSHAQPNIRNRMAKQNFEAMGAL